MQESLAVSDSSNNVRLASQLSLLQAVADFKATVFKTGKTRDMFITRVVKSKAFKAYAPGDHKTFVSIYNWIDVQGELTPKQKSLINGIITKQIPAFIGLGITASGRVTTKTVSVASCGEEEELDAIASRDAEGDDLPF